MRTLWKNRMKKAAAVLSAVSMTAGLLAEPVMAEETEGTAQGRYLEQEVALPENLMPQEIVTDGAGTLHLIARNQEDGGYELWQSSDSGDNWEQAGALPDEYLDTYFTTIKLFPDGSGAGIVMSAKGEGEAVSMDDYQYSYVSFAQTGEAKETVLEGSELFNLALAEGGQALGSAAGEAVCLLNPETGEIIQSLAEDIRLFGTCGEEGILITRDNQVLRYDLTSGDPLPTDETLANALFENGDSYEITTSHGYPIIMTEDEEGRLYYATRRGIFSHIMEGSLVEQVVDGSLISISDPTVVLMSMAVENQCFYLVVADGSGMFRLLRYVYDASVSSVPQIELTIYSLQEQSSIRQAAVEFQKRYPDTYVNYQIGMSGEDGVTVSDALRTLNTDILAGNGPDILVLDGMSVETYAGKGLLSDLSGIVNEIKETDGLLENITASYQDGDVVSAIPMKFMVPCIAGTKEQINNVDSMEAFQKQMEQGAKKSSLGGIFLPEIWYPVCAGAWKTEGNTIDQGKLTQYVQGIKKIYDTFLSTASDTALQELQMFRDDKKEWQLSYEDTLGSIDSSAMNFLSGESTLEAGILSDMTSYVGITSIRLETGDLEIKLLNGQQSGVFIPTCTMSILTTAAQPEAAKNFVTYMLSEEGQTANQGKGFPVNKKALDAVLHEHSDDDDVIFMVSTSDNQTGEMQTLNYYWPTEEELDYLSGLFDQLTVCADTNQVQQETVIDTMDSCLNGEINEEEAVNTIMQKINLYLAEG